MNVGNHLIALVPILACLGCLATLAHRYPHRFLRVLVRVLQWSGFATAVVGPGLVMILEANGHIEHDMALIYSISLCGGGMVKGIFWSLIEGIFFKGTEPRLDDTSLGSEDDGASDLLDGLQKRRRLTSAIGIGVSMALVLAGFALIITQG